MVTEVRRGFVCFLKPYTHLFPLFLQVLNWYKLVDVQPPWRRWLPYICHLCSPCTPSRGQLLSPASLKRRFLKRVEKTKTEERNGELLQRTQESAFLLAGSLSCHTLRALQLEKPPELMGLF